MGVASAVPTWPATISSGGKDATVRMPRVSMTRARSRMLRSWRMLPGQEYFLEPGQEGWFHSTNGGTHLCSQIVDQVIDE